MSLTLTLLGTGTPAPALRRAGSSYLVTTGSQTLLFDCGPFSVRRLLEAGHRPTDVTGLFLTHLHYDHCVDYGHLVLTRWDHGAGRIPDLNVYGPSPTARMTDLLFGEEGVYGPDLAARTQHPGSHHPYELRGGVLPRIRPRPVVSEVAHGDVVSGDGWTVRTAEVVHCQPQLTCLAFRLETGGRSIVFGGDTAPTPVLTELAAGADVLLHMVHFINGVVTDTRLTSCCSGHLDAARTAQAAGVGTLVLVHISDGVDQPGVRERALSDAADVFDGRIILGEDLLKIPLDAPL